MKILFIGSNPKAQGGIETFGRNLQKIFKDDIHFYSYSEKELLYDVENVYKTIDYNSSFGKIKGFLTKVLNKLSSGKIYYYHINKLIDENGYDYILINSPKDLRYLSEKNLNKKIILVQHQTSRRYYMSPSFIDSNPKILEELKKYVTTMVMLSPQDKVEFIEEFELDERKLICIRHTSELPIVTEKKEKIKKLMAICRISNGHKRIDLMLEGMIKLPDYTLEIWGDGPDRIELEKKAEALGLTNVKFMGKTSKVQEKLDEAGIFLMTSDHEGYPIALIEATRRGLPIIVRNTYAAAEDVVRGNGVLLGAKWNVDEFVEAVHEIYENYEKYSEEAIKESEKYNFEVISEEWRKLIK